MINNINKIKRLRNLSIVGVENDILTTPQYATV